MRKRYGGKANAEIGYCKEPETDGNGWCLPGSSSTGKRQTGRCANWAACGFDAFVARSMKTFDVRGWRLRL